jgi:hypothetical protein
MQLISSPKILHFLNQRPKKMALRKLYFWCAKKLQQPVLVHTGRADVEGFEENFSAAPGDNASVCLSVCAAAVKLLMPLFSRTLFAGNFWNKENPQSALSLFL